MINPRQKAEIALQVELAFMAGVGFGQALLEQRMDNNLFDAFAGAMYAQKTGMPLHTVTGSADLDVRPVRYCLRSDEWRKAMFENGKKERDEAFQKIIQMFEQMGGRDD
ncbi:MAG: hypothetical protein KGV56_00395 [Gammaproteobacteria bacterium]|nr:hypothetical protein [Gammaproteobacteria bacterium]